jgi:acetolactate synthase-1/2/3 large subunit
MLAPFGIGALGTAFPMGLGAKLAMPDKKVAIVTGDGGFQYTMNEIATALKEDIPVVVVVLNDGHLGANRGLAENIFDERYMWVDINNPAFAEVAKAYGAEGERVEQPGDLTAAIQRGFDSNMVYVIDAPIDYKFLYPGTGTGPSYKWEPRVWPADPVGTLDPQKFSDGA